MTCCRLAWLVDLCSVTRRLGCCLIAAVIRYRRVRWLAAAGLQLFKRRALSPCGTERWYPAGRTATPPSLATLHGGDITGPPPQTEHTGAVILDIFVVDICFPKAKGQHLVHIDGADLNVSMLPITTHFKSWCLVLGTKYEQKSVCTMQVVHRWCRKA